MGRTRPEDAETVPRGVTLLLGMPRSVLGMLRLNQTDPLLPGMLRVAPGMLKLDLEILKVVPGVLKPDLQMLKPDLGILRAIPGRLKLVTELLKPDVGMLSPVWDPTAPLGCPQCCAGTQNHQGTMNPLPTQMNSS